MGELMLISGIFLFGVAVYMFASSLLSVDEDQLALSWATGNEPQKSKSGFVNLSRPLVHRFCLGLASKVKRPAYRKRVQKKIDTAGLGGELNVDEFIGIQMLWGVLFPLLLILLNFTLELGYPIFIVLFLGALGAYFPHLHADGQKKSRYTSVISDLPFFIDLLALSTEAGLDFISAIQRVVEKTQGTVLGDELSKVLQDLKLGSSREESLRNLANRLDIPEVTSFVTVLIDADSTGASIGSVLKQQSIQMRLERFTRAEKAGARASQLILFPLIVFIIPAVMIMVFGPIIVQFFSGGGS